MKPFYFFIGISVLAGIILASYIISLRKDVAIYSGEARGEAVCSALENIAGAQAFSDSLCESEARNIMQGALDASGATTLHMLATKKGTVLTSFMRPASVHLQILERIARSARFLYHMLAHNEAVPFSFDPQDIAWYISSRDMATTVASLAQENALIARALQDLSQEYRLPLFDIISQLHEVHLVKWQEDKGPESYALVVQGSKGQDMNVIGGRLEQFIAHVMAAKFPQEVKQYLPDRSSTTELIANPSRFVFVPQYQGNRAVRVLQNSEQGITWYSAVQGNRYVFSTSADRLNEILRADHTQNKWRAFFLGCDNYFFTVAHERMMVHLPEGLWYGAIDAAQPSTMHGCLTFSSVP